MLVPTAMLGEALCLATACLWAVALAIYRLPVARWGPRTVNLAKGVVASGMLALTAAATGQLGALATLPPRNVWLLGASGLLGIALGDTALFAAIVELGLHRTLLLQTLAPVFTAAIAAVTTGERLGAIQLLGGSLVLAGVGLVVAPSRTVAAETPASSTRLRIGIGLAVLAAFCQGAGLVMTKAGIDGTPVLVATLLRLATASLGLILFAVVLGELSGLATAARDVPALRSFATACFLGTYLGMLLMVAGLALAPASVAGVLLSTCPLFTLVIEAVANRRLPSLAASGGTVLAVAGVAVLTAAG